MMQLPELKQRGAEAVGSRAGLKRGVNWSQARRSFERQPIKRVDEAMPLQRPSCAHGSQNDEQIPPFPDVKPALKATRLAVARHSGVLTVRRLLEHALVYAGCSPRLLWKLMKDVARSAERKAGRPYAELAPRWAPHPVDFQGPFLKPLLNCKDRLDPSSRGERARRLAGTALRGYAVTVAAEVLVQQAIITHRAVRDSQQVRRGLSPLDLGRLVELRRE